MRRSHCAVEGFWQALLICCLLSSPVLADVGVRRPLWIGLGFSVAHPRGTGRLGGRDFNLWSGDDPIVHGGAGAQPSWSCGANFAFGLHVGGPVSVSAGVSVRGQVAGKFIIPDYLYDGGVYPGQASETFSRVEYRLLCINQTRVLGGANFLIGAEFVDCNIKEDVEYVPVVAGDVPFVLSQRTISSSNWGAILGLSWERELWSDVSGVCEIAYGLTVLHPTVLDGRRWDLNAGGWSIAVTGRWHFGGSLADRTTARSLDSTPF